jgi:hypothetical protein
MSKMFSAYNICLSNLHTRYILCFFHNVDKIHRTIKLPCMRKTDQGDIKFYDYLCGSALVLYCIVFYSSSRDPEKDIEHVIK